MSDCTPPRPRVLIADDQEVVLRGLRDMLEGEFDVLEPVSQLPDLIPAIERLKPDVVVLDISFRGVSSLVPLRKARSNGAITCPIVIYTFYEAESIRESAQAINSVVYVCKSERSEALIDGVRSALSGRIARPGIKQRTFHTSSQRLYDDPAVNDRLAASFPGTGLKHRPVQILLLFHEHHSRSDIAELLGVTPKDIDYHLAKAHSSVGLTDRHQLMRWVGENKEPLQAALDDPAEGGEE